MSDSTAQNSEIQSEILTNLTDPTRPLRSFTVVGKSGACTVPTNVHIRFYRCNFTSFTTQGDEFENGNNFYFEDCTFSNNSGALQFLWCSAVANRCTFSSPTLFEQSKIDLISSTVAAQLTLSYHSYVRSTSNSWKSSGVSDTGVLVSNGAKLESIHDEWSGWSKQFVVTATNGVILLKTPKLTVVPKGFISSDSRSTAIIYNMNTLTGATNNALFTATNNASIEVHDALSISSTGTIFDLRSGILRLKDVITITSVGKVFSLVDSNVFSTGISTVKSTSDRALECSNSTVESHGNTAWFAAKEAVFISNGTARFYGNPSFRSTQTAAITTSGTGNILFLDSPTITSDADSAVDVKFTNLQIHSPQNIIGQKAGIKMLNCSGIIRAAKTIRGVSSHAVQAIQSSVSIVTANNLESTVADAVHVDNDSSLILTGISSLRGGQNGLWLGLRSSAVVQNVNSVVGLGASGVTVSGGSAVSLQKVPLVQGNIHGINVPISSPTGSRNLLRGVGAVTGQTGNGIYAYGGDITVDPSGGNGPTTIQGASTAINISSPHDGVYTLSLVGPVKVAGEFRATNYIIRDLGVNWAGSGTLSRCVWETTTSTAPANFTLNYCYVKQVRGDSIGSWNNAYSTLESFSSRRGNINISSGSASIFGGSVAKASGSGTSTVLAGGLKSGTVESGSDPYQNVVAAFTASGGNMLLQADQTIYLESETLTETIRGDITITTPTTLSIAVGGVTSITLVPGTITLIGPVIEENP